MCKKQKFDSNKDISTVLKYHDDTLNTLKSVASQNKLKSDERIMRSEKTLRDLGIELPSREITLTEKTECKVLVMRKWDDMLADAEKSLGGKCDIESLFTEDELKQNEEAVKLLNNEFNQIYKLDKIDIAITILAGIVGAAVDIVMVGIPEKSTEGLKAGPLSNYIREYFDKVFSKEEMSKLANSKDSKVPYDAQDNRNTTIYIQGLSSYYHRLLQLGHDPLLGFVFGVADILSGTMTTIDKNGDIVRQVIEKYADRKEEHLFSALAKQFKHFKSDITTSMGLPVPLMSLFNLMQFGNIGDEAQTIAEIVQGMYYEGYDFIHFCSMSVSTMLVEVIVRMGYALKSINEGKTIKESIPVSLNREKHPKLSTMLFISHSIATASNTGKLLFTKNPMAINYPQWINFAKYSFTQFKWVMMDKPSLKDDYVSGKIFEEMQDVYDEINRNFEEFAKDKIIIYE